MRILSRFLDPKKTHNFATIHTHTQTVLNERKIYEKNYAKKKNRNRILQGKGKILIEKMYKKYINF